MHSKPMPIAICLVVATTILFVIPLVKSQVDLEGAKAFIDVYPKLAETILHKYFFQDGISSRVFLISSKRLKPPNNVIGVIYQNLLMTAFKPKPDDPSYFQRYSAIAKKMTTNRAHYELQQITELD